MTEIRAELALDEDLAKHVPFNVTARGQSQTDKHKNLYAYREPDADTTAFLEENGEAWFHNPQEFWNGPIARPLDSLTPQVQILCRFLQAGRSDV